MCNINRSYNTETCDSKNINSVIDKYWVEIKVLKEVTKMKFSTGALAASAAINVAEQKRILNHINNHAERQAELARREYKRFNLITILIILLVMFPLCIYIVSSLTNSFDNPVYPNGATKEISGHISLYEDTFWYTDSSKKYEFDFDEYNIDDSYKPGENILIYLDENNNIVSITHETKTTDYGMFIKLILMFVIPIILLLVHAFVGRKTYAKNWSLYVQWYEKEIAPYRYQDNFEEIIANKKYYDVSINIKDLSIEKQKLYMKYRNRNIFYLLLLVVCIIFTIFFYIKFDLNVNSWIGIGIIVIYVTVFYVLIDNCDVEMHRVKNGYYDNK